MLAFVIEPVMVSFAAIVIFPFLGTPDALEKSNVAFAFVPDTVYPLTALPVSTFVIVKSDASGVFVRLSVKATLIFLSDISDSSSIIFTSVLFV